jgi:hypothetical protein
MPPIGTAVGLFGTEIKVLTGINELIGTIGLVVVAAVVVVVVARLPPPPPPPPDDGAVVVAGIAVGIVDVVVPPLVVNE